MIITDLLQNMISLFDNTEKQLQNCYDNLSYVDQQLSDLDHYLELNKLSASKLAKWVKVRKRLREERRDIKNDIEVIECVKKFTDKYNNKLITGDIIQTLKGINTISTRQENPVYAYRTDILKELEE